VLAPPTPEPPPAVPPLPAPPRPPCPLVPAFPPVPAVVVAVLPLVIVPDVALDVPLDVPPADVVDVALPLWVPVEVVVIAEPPAPTAPLVPVPAVAPGEPPAPAVSASSSPCAHDPVAAKNARPTIPMPKRGRIVTLMSPE